MADTEKITININYVDLGKIDLLVEEGFYTNRTDFIRTAIRNQLNTHAEAMQQTTNRRSFAMGILVIDEEDLKKMRAAGQKRSYSIIGMLVIANSVPPELAAEVIEKVTVRGVFQASDAVKAALADRIT